MKTPRIKYDPKNGNILKLTQKSQVIAFYACLDGNFAPIQFQTSQEMQENAPTFQRGRVVIDMK